MKITIKLFGGLSERSGKREFAIEVKQDASVSEALAAIRTAYPDTGDRLADSLEAGYINILLDGRNVRFLKGMETKLRPEGVLAFLPPVGGG